MDGKQEGLEQQNCNHLGPVLLGSVSPEFHRRPSACPCLVNTGRSELIVDHLEVVSFTGKNLPNIHCKVFFCVYVLYFPGSSCEELQLFMARFDTPSSFKYSHVESQSRPAP
jgi:hypothetical protein